MAAIDSLNDLVSDINSGVYKQVVILSGAGISTNSGIPDYRSKNGVFAKLVKTGEYNVKTPETFFSRSFVNKHPEISEHPLVKEFKQQMLDAEPAVSHKLAKWLDDKGILHRVYTQNVDGLYQKAGLSSEKIVEFHGNYNDGSIVLYGDSIPFTALQQVNEDLIDNDNTDLIIVMGSSLQVAPFCAIPNLVNSNCTRVLVDINPNNAMTNEWSKKPRLIDDMYSLGSENSWIKFGKRNTTLRPLWHDKKYEKQYILKMDCDKFAEAIIN